MTCKAGLLYACCRRFFAFTAECSFMMTPRSMGVPLLLPVPAHKGALLGSTGMEASADVEACLRIRLPPRTQRTGPGRAGGRSGDQKRCDSGSTASPVIRRTLLKSIWRCKISELCVFRTLVA